MPLQKRPYKYSLRNADGSFYAFLTHVHKSKLKLALNKPSELSFVLPYDSEIASALVGKAEIWLHDKDDEIVGQYQIHKRRDTNDEMALIEIIAYDALAMLATDTTSDYDTSGAKAVDLIVDDLLALQTDSNPITKGTVATAIATDTKTVAVGTETSLLHVLKNVERTFATPSHFYVDENKQFQWRDLGTYSGFQARVGKNIKSIEREIDYDKSPAAVSGTEDASATDGWQRSQRITVNRKKVGVEQGATGVANFPVKVALKSSDLAAMAQSGGEDVFFTLGGVKQTHQIDSYDNSTGEMVAYVNIPLLPSTIPTELRMFYGNSGAADQGGTVDHDPSGKTQAWQDTFAEQSDNYDEFTTVSPGTVKENDPLVSYTLNLQDLYEISGDSFEKLVLGDSIWVQDDVLGIATEQTITSLSRNLDKPWEVSITLLNEPRDAVDDITDVIKDTERQDDEIDSARADILTNAGDIATNAGDISDNAGDIATNAADIADETNFVKVLFGQVTADTSSGGRKKYSVETFTNPGKISIETITDVYIVDDSFGGVSVSDWVYVLFSPDITVWGHVLIPQSGGVGGTVALYPVQWFSKYNSGIASTFDS